MKRTVLAQNMILALFKNLICSKKSGNNSVGSANCFYSQLICKYNFINNFQTFQVEMDCAKLSYAK